MKKYLQILIVPFLYILFALFVSYTWKLFHLPSPEEFLPVIKLYFDQYGVLIVFAASLIEAAFVVGSWVPGSVVIFMGVVFSIGNAVQAVAVVLSVIVGFIIGFTADFYLGKYGWYKLIAHFGFAQGLENTKKRIQKYGLSIPWLGYHTPDLGSFIATSYGILGYSYKKFLMLSAPPVIFWCTFWGSVTYIFGEKVLSILGWKTLFIILIVWVIARVVEVKFMDKEEISIN